MKRYSGAVMKITMIATVKGRVQGVGFRYFTAHQANKTGVEGYAKNLNNGDVEVLMTGSKEKVLSFIEWLKQGPRTSNVDGLNAEQVEYREYKGFAML